MFSFEKKHVFFWKKNHLKKKNLAKNSFFFFKNKKHRLKKKKFFFQTLFLIEIVSGSRWTKVTCVWSGGQGQQTGGDGGLSWTAERAEGESVRGKQREG